jgi:peptidoglycan/LPS O-acetylase OafA/YrhL
MKEDRLYCLDALRTLAALFVVLAHFPEHFFVPEAFRQPFSAAPFYDWIALAYDWGGSAVKFFFCLSGFIFFWLYADAVHRRKVGLRQFAVLRFSRLYPLHLLTLLTMAPLLYAVQSLTGDGGFYKYNDLYHFILNLGFVQYWGLEKGFSWNGPSWSISVEIALYLLFFISCRLFRPGIVLTVGLMLVAYSFARFSAVPSAALGFFSGGAWYYAYRVVLPRCTWRTALLAAIAAIAAWWMLAPLCDKAFAAEVSAEASAFLPGGAIGATMVRLFQIVCGRLLEIVLFPMIILSFALLERTSAMPWKALSGLGDISFTVYLTHVPLQLVFLIIATVFSFPADTFTKPVALLIFLGILIPLSMAVYRFVELPAKQSIRRRLLSRRPAKKEVLLTNATY